MAGKITLDDLVKKDPSEIVQQIQVNAAAAPSVPTEDAVTAPVNAEVVSSSNGVATEEKGLRKKLTYDKSLLKGRFIPTTEFKKGEKHSVVLTVGTEGNETPRTDVLEVVSVEKSAGRVKFKDEATQEIFSVAFNHLFGQEKVMPFKKGDVVRFEEKDFEVKGLNPASQNVVLLIDGKQRYVKINKVTLVSSAPVVTETPVVVEAPALVVTVPPAA